LSRVKLPRNRGEGKWRNYTTVESVCAASSFLAGQLRRLAGASVLFMDQVTITCPNCNYAMPPATEIPADAVCSRCGKPLPGASPTWKTPRSIDSRRKPSGYLPMPVRRIRAGARHSTLVSHRVGSSGAIRETDEPYMLRFNGGLARQYPTIAMATTSAEFRINPRRFCHSAPPRLSIVPAPPLSPSENGPTPASPILWCGRIPPPVGRASCPSCVWLQVRRRYTPKSWHASDSCERGERRNHEVSEGPGGIAEGFLVTS
jgi:hypothetical protein